MSTKKYRLSLIGILILFALAGLLCFASCNNQSQKSYPWPADTETKVISDMLGRSVEVPAHATRIVGIGAGSLRVISYLEAVDKVVGVEASEVKDSPGCCYNHAYHNTFKDLPIIGEGGAKGTTPNEEALMQVKPDVIFANIDRDAACALQRKTNIPVVCIKVKELVFDQSFYDSLTLVGSIVDKQERAQEIIDYMHATQDDLAARTAGIDENSIKTAYAAGINFRGGHGFAGTEANFPPFDEVRVKNIADASATGTAFDIDLEAVVSAQPDYIFLESNNLALIKDDYAANPNYFSLLSAVQNNAVNTLISYRFYSTNVELALANCYQVGAMVYPERFSDVDPVAKLDEITKFFLGVKLSGDLEDAGYVFRQVDLANI